ncbi:MAG: hypothetical protein HQ567_16345 [Candidatus Nealsonbacteria bacterium]|nr:hypothetical protein [Candidatus Nealsonbacteria bacterium]
MPNEIRIQPPSEQIVRGTPMTVRVTVVLDEPLKVRGMHAKFHGAEETRAVYTTSSTDSKGRVTTQTHTAVEHVDVTTQAHLMSGNERLGFFGNLSDAVATIFGGGKHETMQPGEYPFDVEVSIPDDAPPTHVGEKTRVFYELSFQVDVPLATDLKATQSFDLAVLPAFAAETNPVRTRYPDDEGRGLMDSLLGPDVRIELALAADRFRPGELIEGIFRVETDKPLNCRSIRVRLVGVETSQAHGHGDSYAHLGKPVEVATPGVFDGSYKQEFSLPAEAEGPLTAKGKLFSIDWFVQVELDVPWAKDPKIRAPIALCALPASGLGVE